MTAPDRSRMRGFALAESLVALTLLSLGLAYAVAVLVQCLRHEREAAARSAALRLAVTLGEELRAWRAPDGRALLAITGVAAELACAGRPASCAMEAAAASVLDQWRNALAAQTPIGASGSVTVPDPAVPTYRIRIDWPSSHPSGVAVLELIVEA